MNSFLTGLLLCIFLVQGYAGQVKTLPGPLLKNNLEEMEKEWPWTEYSEMHAAIKNNNFTAAESILSILLLEIESGSERLKGFRKSYSWGPAQFFVLSTPTNVSLPVLRRIQARLTSVEMKHGLDFAILSSLSRTGDFARAVKHLEPLNSSQNTCPELESTITGLSSQMMHGYPALAAKLCTNFFGSFENPKFKFRTNLFTFMHFAAIKKLNKDTNGALAIIEVLRSKHPDYYAENHDSIFGQLVYTYFTLQKYIEIAKLAAEDLEAFKGGKLKLNSKDQKRFLRYVDDLQKSGWLDDNFKPRTPLKNEDRPPIRDFPPLL